MAYHITMKIRHLAVAILLSIQPAFSEGLPDLGDISQSTLAPIQERRLGESIMREIRSDPSYLEDSEVHEYLNSIGYRLAANSPDSRQDFEFFPINDNAINAFALPGGFIGIHTGLILAAQTESELASAMAHEISHVTQHHLARMIAGQKNSFYTTIAALAVAILAARSNGQVANAAIATAQASSIQSQLNFTRENEQEADRIGFQTLVKSGFDPRAMATFFERLQRANRVSETNAPSYLRTHPVTFERIADAQNRAQNLPYKQVPDSLEFQLIRAKLRANQDSAKDALVFFESNLAEKKYSSEIAQRYGLAATLARLKNDARADKEMALLKTKAPPNAIIETLAAQIKARINPATAVESYRTALKAFPDHRALIYDYISTLLQNRQYAEALKFTGDKLATLPNDGRLYEFQAKASALLGKRFLQHQAQAEYYVRSGRLAAAIEQLQFAVKSNDANFYQLSTAEARLRELRVLDAEKIQPVTF